jgi:hypothetical protein
MAISSRRAGAAHLREAIEAYRAKQKDKLDKPALELLARLADSPQVGTAFEALKLNGRSAEENILLAFIATEQLVRTFPARLAQAKEVLARLKRLERDLATLRRYVDEIAKQKHPPPSDLLSTRIVADSWCPPLGKIISNVCLPKKL